MIEKVKELVKGQLAIWMTGPKTDKKIWIFSSTDNKNFNYNSRYLFLYVLKHHPEIDARFVINDQKLREELTKEYGDHFCETKSMRGMRAVCRAGVWFTSAGLPVYGAGAGKRHIIINLWHGVPLKKIVLMEPSVSLGKRCYFKKIFSDNYRAILTTSRQLVPIMAESFGVEESRIKVWGQPRNDELNRSREQGTVRQGKAFSLRKQYGDGQKLVLYAPTYREYAKTRLFPFEDWDKDTFCEFLERQNIVFFLRTHIEESGSISPYLGKRIVRLGTDVVEDITEMLPAFDLLVTDYSSIFIDYLLLDRPMVFLPYDREEYLSRRGMNFDYDSITPGKKPSHMKEFMNDLQQSLENDTEAQNRMQVNRMLNEILEPCQEAICAHVLQGELD